MKLNPKVLVGVGVGAGLLAAAGVGVKFYTGKERESGLSVEPVSSPVSGPDPTRENFPPAQAPNQTFNITPTPESEWLCATIGDPGVPNAFRGIKAAGDPTIWEKGPYQYIPVTGTSRVVNSWSELSMTQKGDRVCVVKGSQDINSRHGTLFLASRDFDTKGKGFQVGSWQSQGKKI
jgi:hypothetical protein